jgi:hypothetical protein
MRRLNARFAAKLKKRLGTDAPLYTLLQILSVTLYEKMPLQHAFPGNDYTSQQNTSRSQLNLFAI